MNRGALLLAVAATTACGPVVIGFAEDLGQTGGQTTQGTATETTGEEPSPLPDYVAVGFNQHIIASFDRGRTWETFEGNGGPDDLLEGVARGPDRIVAVGGDFSFVTIDGRQWDQATSFLGYARAIVYGEDAWWSGPLDPRGVPDALQTDGTPNGWHVLQVEGTRASVDYRAAGHPATHQMRVRFLVERAKPMAEAETDAETDPGRWSIPEGPLDPAALARTWISVNLFDGGPRSKVTAHIAGLSPIELTREVLADPFVAEVYAQAPERVKSWVEPEPSAHFFLAPLPQGLSPGVHPVRIEAEDEFGRRHHGHALLELGR